MEEECVRIAPTIQPASTVKDVFRAITDQWIVCQTIHNHVFRAIVHLPERSESVVRLGESVVAWKDSLVLSARNACQDIRAIGAVGVIVMHEAHFRGGNAMRGAVARPTSSESAVIDVMKDILRWMKITLMDVSSVTALESGPSVRWRTLRLAVIQR